MYLNDVNMKTISLKFNGYYENNLTDKNCKNCSGIYLVYRGIDKGKTCSIKKLIYIGESEDISKRISEHNKWDEWKKQLQNGEKLYFCYAKANEEDRQRAEAALIYKYKPVCNKEFTGKFDDFADTEIIIEQDSRCAFIENFSVKKQ